jgi:hypothetical protein
VIKTPDQFTPSGFAGGRGVACGLEDQLGLLDSSGLPKFVERVFWSIDGAKAPRSEREEAGPCQWLAVLWPCTLLFANTIGSTVCFCAHAPAGPACPSRNGRISSAVLYLPSNFFRSNLLLPQGLTLGKSDLYWGVSDTVVRCRRRVGYCALHVTIFVVYSDVEGIAVFQPQ